MLEFSLFDTHGRKHTKPQVKWGKMEQAHK